MTLSDARDAHAERSGLELVIQKAIIDPEFRKELLSDPVRAIELAFDVHLPAGLRLRFIEKDPDVDVMVVLPDLVRQEKADDFGEALDDVRGGATPVWLDEISRMIRKVPWG